MSNNPVRDRTFSDFQKDFSPLRSLVKIKAPNRLNSAGSQSQDQTQESLAHDIQFKLIFSGDWDSQLTRDTWLARPEPEPLTETRSDDFTNFAWFRFWLSGWVTCDGQRRDTCHLLHNTSHITLSRSIHFKSEKGLSKVMTYTLTSSTNSLPYFIFPPYK